jgi:hypothetical protein
MFTMFHFCTFPKVTVLAEVPPLPVLEHPIRATFQTIRNFVAFAGHQSGRKDPNNKDLIQLYTKLTKVLRDKPLPVTPHSQISPIPNSGAQIATSKFTAVFSTERRCVWDNILNGAIMAS